MARLLKVLLVLAIVAGAVYFLRDFDWKKKFDLMPKVPVAMQCPDTMQSNDAGLCFDKCPEGYDWDRAATCYQPCPADWPGSSTITHCQKARVHSPARSVVEVGSCPADKEQLGELCYERCAPGWERKGTLDCYENCPAGFSDNGLYCAKPGPETRRSYCWGVFNQPHAHDPRRSCVEENPQGCEQSAPTCWIPLCRANFHGAGIALCSPDCPAGWQDIGVSCKKPSNMTSSRPTTRQCPPDRDELIPSGCYERCGDNLQRVSSDLEFCTSICPPGMMDIGIGGCAKATTSVGSKPLTEVGVCSTPTHPRKEGLLCYPE